MDNWEISDTVVAQTRTIDIYKRVLEIFLEGGVTENRVSILLQFTRAVGVKYPDICANVWHHYYEKTATVGLHQDMLID